MLNIIKSTEPMKVETVKILIFGEPGTGKTSTAFTAVKTILFDFDNGAYRSKNRGDVVSISNWDETANILKEDLKDYDTICIDTIGRALDYLQSSIIEKDKKNVKKLYTKLDGSLSLQGYGVLKLYFTNWFKQLSVLGKDIIMISHSKEDKDGDKRYYRPDITGGSYGEVIKVVDFAGYMFKVEKATHLDFNPTEAYIGKNSAGFGLLQIPDYTKDPNYFAEIIKQMKASLNSISEEQVKALQLIDKAKTAIDKATTPNELNAIMNKVKEQKNGIKQQIWVHLKTKADLLGFDFIPEQKVFIAIPKKETPKQEIIEEQKKDSWDDVIGAKEETALETEINFE